MRDVHAGQALSCTTTKRQPILRGNLFSGRYQGKMCLNLSISSVIPDTYAVITGKILCSHASLLDNDIVRLRRLT